MNTSAGTPSTLVTVVGSGSAVTTHVTGEDHRLIQHLLSSAIAPAAASTSGTVTIEFAAYAASMDHAPVAPLSSDMPSVSSISRHVTVPSDAVAIAVRPTARRVVVIAGTKLYVLEMWNGSVPGGSSGPAASGSPMAHFAVPPYRVRLAIEVRDVAAWVRSSATPWAVLVCRSRGDVATPELTTCAEASLRLLRFVTAADSAIALPAAADAFVATVVRISRPDLVRRCQRAVAVASGGGPLQDAPGQQAAASSKLSPAAPHEAAASVDSSDATRAARRDRLRVELAATQAALASGDVDALLSPSTATLRQAAVPSNAISPSQSRELTLAEIETELRTVVVECAGPLCTATDVLTELGLLRGAFLSTTSKRAAAQRDFGSMGTATSTASVGCPISFPHLSLPILASATLERGFAAAHPAAASQFNDAATTHVGMGAASGGAGGLIAAVKRRMGVSSAEGEANARQRSGQEVARGGLSSDRPEQDALGLTGAPGSGSAAVGMNVSAPAMAALARRIRSDFGERTVAYSALVRMRTESTHDCVVVTEASLIFAKARKDRLLCRVPLSAIDGCVLDATDPGLLLLQIALDLPGHGASSDASGGTTGGTSVNDTAVVSNGHAQAATGPVTNLSRDIVVRFTTAAEAELWAAAASEASGVPSRGRDRPTSSHVQRVSSYPHVGAKLRRQFVAALSRSYEMSTLRRLRADVVPDAARLRRGVVEFRVEQWVGGLKSHRDQMLALARRGADSVVDVGKRLTTVPIGLVASTFKQRPMKSKKGRGDDEGSSDGAHTPRSSGSDGDVFAGSDAASDASSDSEGNAGGAASAPIADGALALPSPAETDAARRLLVALLNTPLQFIQTLNAAMPAVSCFTGSLSSSHTAAAGDGVPVDDLEYWARTIFRAQAAVDLRTQRHTLLQLLQLARWAESLRASSSENSNENLLPSPTSPTPSPHTKDGVSALCKELLRSSISDAISLLSFEDTRVLGVLRPVLATELARFALHRRANAVEAERVHRAVQGLVATAIRQCRTSQATSPAPPATDASALNALHAKEAQLTQLRSRLVAVFPYLHDELAFAASESAGASADIAVGGASDISGGRSATLTTGRHTSTAHGHGAGGPVNNRGASGGATGQVFPSALYHIADPFQVSFTAIALRHYLGGSGRRGVALLPPRWVAALGASGQRHHVHEHIRSPARLRAASVGVAPPSPPDANPNAAPSSPDVRQPMAHEQEQTSNDGALSELLAARMILSEPLEAFYCDPMSLRPDPPMAVRVNWALSILQRFLPYLPPAVEYARRTAERTAPANGAPDFAAPALGSFYPTTGAATGQAELISAAVVTGEECFSEALKVVAATIFDLMSDDPNLTAALGDGAVVPDASVGYAAEDWRSAIGSVFFTRFLYRNLCDPVGRKIVDASSLPVLSASQRRTQHSHLLDVMALIQSVACLTPLPLLSRPFAYDAATAAALFLGVPLSVVAEGATDTAATSAAATSRLDFAHAAVASLWEPMIEFLTGCVSPAAARGVSACSLLASAPTVSAHPLDGAAIAFTHRVLSRCDGSALHRPGRGACVAGLDVERFAWSSRTFGDRRIARLLGSRGRIGFGAKVYDNVALAKRWHRVTAAGSTGKGDGDSTGAAPVPVADAVQRALVRYLSHADARAELALARVLISLDGTLREHVSGLVLASCAFTPATAASAATWYSPDAHTYTATSPAQLLSPTSPTGTSSLRSPPASPAASPRPVASARELLHKRNTAITATQHAATVRAAAEARSAHAAEAAKLRRQIALLQEQLAAANARELQVRRDAARHIEWATNAAATGFLAELHNRDAAAAKSVRRQRGHRDPHLIHESRSSRSSSERDGPDCASDSFDEQKGDMADGDGMKVAPVMINPFLGSGNRDVTARHPSRRVVAGSGDALSRGPYGAGAHAVVGCPMDAAPLWGVGVTSPADQAPGKAVAAVSSSVSPALDYGALSVLATPAAPVAAAVLPPKPQNPFM